MSHKSFTQSANKSASKQRSPLHYSKVQLRILFGYAGIQVACGVSRFFIILTLACVREKGHKRHGTETRSDHHMINDPTGRIHPAAVASNRHHPVCMRHRIYTSYLTLRRPSSRLIMVEEPVVCGGALMQLTTDDVLQ